MGTIKIELKSPSRPWGLFTEEEKPRIILPTWLTKEGQAIEFEEEDLTPNQLQIVETSYVMGIIKVEGASFLRKRTEKTKGLKVKQIFSEEEEEPEEETPYEKLIREKKERVEARRKMADPTVKEEEVISFLKKRQDKLIIEIKKSEKSMSFFKECLKKENDRKKPRKKVLSSLEEVIEYKIASIKSDVGGIQVFNSGDITDKMKGLSKGPSMLEQEYTELITEEELDGPEEPKSFTKEEIEALVKKFEENS